jgi:hypothetical protein
MIPFVQVENAVLDSPILSKEDRVFYIALKAFRNRKNRRCFPSIHKIAERAGICDDTAYKCRKKLKCVGVIDWTSERGRGHSCKYRFVLEDGTSGEISEALRNLNGNKIPETRGYLNTRNEGVKIPPEIGSKIPDEKGTNNKKLTKRNNKKKEPASLTTPEGGSPVLEEEEKYMPMPRALKDPLKEMPSAKVIDNDARKAELLRQVEELNQTHNRGV